MREKSILAVLLAFCMICMLPGQCLAAEYQENISQDVHEDGLNIQSLMNSVSVTYAVNDGEVVENATFADVDGSSAYISQTIRSDGTGTLLIRKGGKEETIALVNQDYDLFMELASMNSNHGIQTRGTQIGKEITGSQYKHIYIGSSSYTVNNDSVTQIAAGGASTAAGIIASIAGASIPTTILIAAGGFLWTVISACSPYKVQVSQTVYEVHFTYDDGYYIHCYHQVLKSYDSGNHLIDTTKAYQQSIGG